MGLYLCVFDGEDEVEGVDAGSYSDFGFFRDAIAELVDGGTPGAKCPTLILHSDCDGEWTVAECVALERELNTIVSAFRELPAIEFHSDWQREVGRNLGLRPQSLADSFIDVDGEPLLERLLALCHIAQERGQPILFQ